MLKNLSKLGKWTINRRAYALLSRLINMPESILLQFCDKNRNMQTVQATVAEVDKQHLVIYVKPKCDISLPCGWRCSIIIQPQVGVENTSLWQKRKQKTYILHARLERSETLSASSLYKFILKIHDVSVHGDLRKFSRNSIFKNIDYVAELWIINKMNPESMKLESPDFYYEQNVDLSLKIIDLSAGGAQIEIDNVEYIEKFQTIENDQILLHYTFNPSLPEQIDTWVNGKCISAQYDLGARRLAMRLEWLPPRVLEESLQA